MNIVLHPTLHILFMTTGTLVNVESILIYHMMQIRELSKSKHEISSSIRPLRLIMFQFAHKKVKYSAKRGVVSFPHRELNPGLLGESQVS